MLVMLVAAPSSGAQQSFKSGEAGYSFTVPTSWQLAVDPGSANAKMGIVNLFCGMPELARTIPSGSAAIMIDARASTDSPAKMLNDRRRLASPGFSRTSTAMDGRPVEVLSFKAKVDPETPGNAPIVYQVTDVAFRLGGRLVWVQLTDHGCPKASHALATVVGSLRPLQ